MASPADDDDDQVTPLAELLSGRRRPVTTGRAPIPRLPHLDDPAFETRRVGTADAPDAPQIFIFRDVLEELRYRSAFDPEASSACLLTGGWFLGPGGGFVEVDGFRDTVAVDSALALVRYLRAHRDLVSPRVSAVHAAELVVGCAQLRAGCAARFGADDLVLLNSFFPRPWHLMLMIDPRSGELGFFVRTTVGQIVNAPFYLVAAGDEAPEAVQGG